MNLDKFSGENFYNIIKVAADQNNLSINAIAGKLGVPTSTLTRWRDGLMNPRFSTIRKIYANAAKLGIKVD